jgi:hypothetical protein
MSIVDITIKDFSKEQNFNEYCIEIFQHQSKYNAIYRQYLSLLDFDGSKVTHFSQIPFLPISFFKSHSVKTGIFESSHIFKSSNTTGKRRSQHHIKNISWYHQNSKKCFEYTFGDLKQYIFMGLLPNYLEQGASSLVSMVDFFMLEAQKHQNYFFLKNHDQLLQKITQYSNQKVILFGVSFALLDFSEAFCGDFPNLILIETGGMKGRKKEIIKSDLYKTIEKSFPESSLFSEYGMTELLSQAYSKNNGKYIPPPWFKVLPRSINDPLSNEQLGKQCALNIIDLANQDSCCFIATDDIGKIFNDGSFEVLGRMDHSEIRGCSQMVID